MCLTEWWFLEMTCTKWKAQAKNKSVRYLIFDRVSQEEKSAWFMRLIFYGILNNIELGIVYI